MLVHRNIGAEELLTLVKDKVVKGNYKLTPDRNILDNSNMYGTSVISFFASDYWWIDDKHTYEVWVDVPDCSIISGKGVYYSNEQFAKTHVWNGREGNIRYEIPEVYVTEYNVVDVRLIKTVRKPIANVIQDIMKELNIEK